jgi:hypothetical protein
MKGDAMDLSASTLFADLVVSVVGFAYYRYGRKQERPLHVVTGISMMTVPTFVGGGALGVFGVGAGLAVAAWIAIRLGF